MIDTNTILATIETLEKPGDVLAVMKSLGRPYSLELKKKLNRSLYSLADQGIIAKSQPNTSRKPLWSVHFTPNRLIHEVEQSQYVEEKLLKIQAKYNGREIVITSRKTGDKYYFEVNYSSWYEGIDPKLSSEYGLTENTHALGEMMLPNWPGYILIGFTTKKIYYLGRDYEKVEFVAENINDFVNGKWAMNL